MLSSLFVANGTLNYEPDSACLERLYQADLRVSTAQAGSGRGNLLPAVTSSKPSGLAAVTDNHLGCCAYIRVFTLACFPISSITISGISSMLSSR